MKYIGAVMIFFTCTLIGTYAADRKKRALDECRAFLDMMIYVKNQIGYFSAPTKEIYRAYENNILEDIGFLPAIRSCGNDEVYIDAFVSAFDSIEPKLSVSPDIKRLIRTFGSEIGKSMQPQQMKTFDFCIDNMNEREKELKTQTQKDVKLCRVLGISAGAAAVILII
ncbi:MAG: stage III sporulation protein AB [Clostridia bacterium]|nr:stage III sporulation protein AB [Clostridia bacterium]